MSPGGSIVYVSGQQNGAIGVQLTDAELPAHDHSLNGMLGAGADTVGSPENNSLSRYLPAPPQPVYSTATSPDKLMSGSSLGMFGAGDAHENRQPSLELNFYIAWDGIYPVPA
jgi:microcystin-dependent protein